MRRAHHRRAVGRLINVLPEGVALCGTTGRIAYRNGALMTLLAADPEAPRLAEQIGHAAAGAATLVERRPSTLRLVWPHDATALHDVRTAIARYQLRASHVGQELLGPDAAVLVVVARVVPHELTSDELRARYGLTPREVQVTYLLARGTSNADIARALNLSAATARHYTEHVLVKLGLHSRAQVANALRDAT